MYLTVKAAKDDAELFKWFHKRARSMTYKESSFAKPFNGRFAWQTLPEGPVWEKIRCSEPWVSASSPEVSGHALSSMSNIELPNRTRLKKPYVELKPTRKRAFDAAIKENTSYMMQQMMPIEGITPSVVEDIRQSIYPGKRPRVEVAQNVWGEALPKAYNWSLNFGRRDTTTQLGSLLVAQRLPKADIERGLHGATLTSQQLTRFRHHADTVGPGVPIANTRSTKRNVLWRSEIIKKLISFLIKLGVLTASATPIYTDGGDKILLPVVYRTQPIKYLGKLFLDEQKRGCTNFNELQLTKRTENKGKRLYLAPSTQDIRTIIKVVCPRIIKCLAALDTQSHICGLVNFKKMRELCTALKATPQQQATTSTVGTNPQRPIGGPARPSISTLCNAVLERSNEIEAFIKDRQGMWATEHYGGGAGGNHASDNGPACHCSWYSFGEEDPNAPKPFAPGTSPCGHNHGTVGCCKCNKVMEYSLKTKELIDALEQEKSQCLSLLVTGTTTTEEQNEEDKEALQER
jgi:hypothetical protein